jgi:uncharacterized protein (DUF1330 family)
VAGYLIANIDVTEPAKFEEYREKVMPLIEKFGGRYLVRGGDVRRLEGNLPLHRLWFWSSRRSRPPSASMTAPSTNPF